jgi:hypothetical protein
MHKLIRKPQLHKPGSARPFPNLISVAIRAYCISLDFSLRTSCIYTVPLLILTASPFGTSYRVGVRMWISCSARSTSSTNASESWSVFTLGIAWKRPNPIVYPVFVADTELFLSRRDARIAPMGLWNRPGKESGDAGLWLGRRAGGTR